MYRPRPKSRPGQGRPPPSTKALQIPTNVPVGVVIGKGGSTCRMLRDNYGVQCQVDADRRTAKLSGTRSGIAEAEAELARLFEEFSVSPRVFEVGALDGPEQLWQFHERSSPASDENVAEHTYRLEPIGPSGDTEAVRLKTWIQSFSRSKTDEIMAYLLDDEHRGDATAQVKLSFGQLCFKLRKVSAHDTFTWDELQKMRVGEDFSSRWSNNCTVSLMPEVEKLQTKLNVADDQQWRAVMSVHVHSTSPKRSWNVKYWLVDDVWKLKSCQLSRRVLGTYDVILDSKTSFRVRAQVHDAKAEQSSEGVQRYLSVRREPDSDFFATSVVLGANAPEEMSIHNPQIKWKTRTELDGIKFSIGYTNQQHSEVCLKCWLSEEAKSGLGAEDNEHQVLVDKVLGMIA